VLNIAAILILLFLPACKHDPPEAPLPTHGHGNAGGSVNIDPCDPDSVYFQNEVLPMLISSCVIAACHDAGTAEDGRDFTNYAGVLEGAK
jgi:hypothetical protein